MSADTSPSLGCVIIDDEQPAHDVLKYHIDNTPWLNFNGSLYNSVDALTKLAQLNPDIIFLDVNMPNLSGLQLLDIIPVKASRVIITSAHSEYALEGYHFDEVSSFLLKPITFQLFLKAVNKIRILCQQEHILSGCTDQHYPISFSNNPGKIEVRDLNQAESTRPFFVEGDDSGSEFHNTDDALWVKVEKKMYRINFGDIKFIEGQKNYVDVHFNSNDQLRTRVSLGEMEKKLPPKMFVRTHKSYIVNCGAIKQIDGNTITLDNSSRVSISPMERDVVFRLLRF